MQDLYRLSQKKINFRIFLYIPFIVVCFVTSVWVGTEYIYFQAKTLSFDLGPHAWFSCLPWSIAKNLSLLNSVITDGLHVAFALMAGSFLVVHILFLFFQRNIKETDTHGSSRWSNWDDLKRSGLLNQENGIYIGKYSKPGRHESYLLRDNSDTHAIVVAPTGSGKGVGLVIPNLLTWKGSVIVHDLKGENYNITSGFRKNGLGQNVFKFDPSCEDGSGARFNPLSEIRKGLYEVKDTQAIVDMIVDPKGEGKPSHWDKTADAFLCGVILHVLYSSPNKTLTGVLHALSNPNRDIDELLVEMTRTHHDPQGLQDWKDPDTQKSTKIHPVIASIAQEMRSKEKPERSGVVSTASSFLSLYRDPLIARNTSKSDFSINDLMKGDRPASLYLIIAPSEQKRVYSLTRLLVNQFCVRLMENVQTDDRQNLNGHKFKMLFMMDEFTSLGRLEVFQDTLSYMRGYGIRTFLICQDLEQLKAKYGERTSILSHCKTKIFFATNSKVTADQISQYAGESTVIKYSKSYSETNPNHISEGASEIRRSLLTSDEATRLPKDAIFVHREGEQPLLIKKINYLHNSDFAKRAVFDRLIESDRLPGRDQFVMVPETEEKPAKDQAISGVNPAIVAPVKDQDHVNVIPPDALKSL